MNGNVNSKTATPFFKRDGVKSVLSSLICIAGGILVGLIVLLLLAAFSDKATIKEAFTGILKVLKGPFSAGNRALVLTQIGDTLFNAMPLIFTGLSVAIAFKTGLFNIGAPGQYLMGAMTALLISLTMPTDVVPPILVWLIALIGGALSGMLWGAIPGLFKAMLGVNEVIVCIMCNWVAANIVSWVFKANEKTFVNYAETKMNFIRKTASNGVSTPKFGLDRLFKGSYIDISIFIAILVAVALYIMLTKTTFGYELRACGFNRNASKYAGMNEKRNIVLSLAIAGALAGCGAALWCINGAQDFKWDVSMSLPAVGFNGIPAALLASNNPIGTIFSAIFLKYIDRGGANLAMQSSFNEYVSQLIIAVIIYFAGFAKFIKDLLDRKKSSSKPKLQTAPDYAKVAREIAEDKEPAGAADQEKGDENK